MRRIAWNPNAWADYVRIQSDDKRLWKKINTLVDDVLRHPEEGLGKPERLRADLAGMWSRRISQEHRLVYVIEPEQIVIIQCSSHYQAV